MKISNFQQQKISDNCFFNTFTHDSDKVKEIINTFTNKGLINFKDGDFTSIFTLFGSEFNNVKHSSLIPFDTAWERLTNAINKEKDKLPTDFKWSAVAEYKYKKGQGWRLHFHLLHNYRLKYFDYSERNNEVLYNSEYFIGSYLTKDFQFTINQGISPYVFSPNCKDKVKEIINDFTSYYNLYAKLKKQAKNKRKVKEESIYYSDLFRLTINSPRCRGSPP